MKRQDNPWMWIAILAIIILVFTQISDLNLSSTSDDSDTSAVVAEESSNQDLESEIIPADGVVLPVKWGSFGKDMMEAGIIDEEKFVALYEQRGGLGDYEKELLYGDNVGKLKIDNENSRYVLNLLWAFGIANKNAVLEEGTMSDPKYNGPGRFASTGGWKLAKGDTMDHFSKHEFVTLTSEQQTMVEEVSKNIYRPCCGNSTYFPDCNHGMAMLGLLELLAAQGANEKEMYDIALKVNSYWFPSTYLTIANYKQSQGVDWKNVDAKEVLGAEYSSSAGYKNLVAKTQPVKASGGGSCGA